MFSSFLSLLARIWFNINVNTRCMQHNPSFSSGRRGGGQGLINPTLTDQWSCNSNYLRDLDLGLRAGDRLPSSRSMSPGLESLEEKCLNSWKQINPMTSIFLVLVVLCIYLCTVQCTWVYSRNVIFLYDCCTWVRLIVYLHPVQFNASENVQLPRSSFVQKYVVFIWS